MPSPVIVVLQALYNFVFLSFSVLLKFIFVTCLWNLLGGFCFLICMATLIRAPDLINYIREDDSENWREKSCQTVLVLVFVDFPTLFPSLVVLVSIYRIPKVAKKWDWDIGFNFGNHGRIWRHGSVICQSVCLGL